MKKGGLKGVKSKKQIQCRSPVEESRLLRIEKQKGAREKKLSTNGGLGLYERRVALPLFAWYEVHMYIDGEMKEDCLSLSVSF